MKRIKMLLADDREVLQDYAIADVPTVRKMCPIAGLSLRKGGRVREEAHGTHADNQTIPHIIPPH